MNMVPIKLGLTILSFVTVLNYSVGNNYDGGLILYNPSTNHKLLPPVVTSAMFKSTLRLPFIGQPCSCKSLTCGCCVGIKVERLGFDQKLCSNITFQPSQFGLRMDVFLNQRNIIMYALSARNPPPFCIPVNLPIPVDLCIQLFDIKVVNTSLNMCMDWQVKVWTNELFVLHFNCIQMGFDGVNLVTPTGSDLIQGMGGPTDNFQPFDNDVLDPVDLDRRNFI